jgi:hypothetical protein
MKLPLLISVPHAGKHVPYEVKNICILSKEDILADSDEGASAIYYTLEEHCEAFITSDIARALIDLNRPSHDIGGDGVIKSHTCWNVPVYRDFPDPATKPSGWALTAIPCQPVGRRLDPTPARKGPWSVSAMQTEHARRSGSTAWPAVLPKFSRKKQRSIHHSVAGISPGHMRLKCPGFRLKFHAQTHTQMNTRETACLKDCNVFAILCCRDANKVLSDCIKQDFHKSQSITRLREYHGYKP